VSGHALGTYLKGDEIPTYLQLLEGLPPSKVDPVRIVAEPQTEYKYSGGGYLIALQTMIDVTRQSFFDIMNEAVLSPAGMKRSGYFQPLEYGSVENVAVGHGGMNTVLDGYWQTMANPAGGGLWTTPTDLCLFAIEIQKALRSKSSVISRELAEEMLTSHMGDYGLGLFLHGKGENLAFSHGGGNAGYQGYFFAYAGRGQGVAVMTNSINGHYVYNEVLRSVAIVYDWPDMKPTVIKPVQVPLETLNAYKGRYLWNNALGAEITVENDHLKMEGDDGRIFLFYPESDNHFYDLYSGWDLKFIFNEHNEVTGAFMGMGEEAGFKAEKIDK
jgi:CubicO group peptidase (beta-lactamase class C family)